MKISTQTKISWIQLIFGNTLLYPVSVSNLPEPERGIFCILIVDIIFRSTLVVFSLLRASNYQEKMGLFVTYCHYTVITTRLNYKYCSYLSYCDIHQCRYIFCYCPLTYDDSIICIMFYYKLSRNFNFITNIESVHL